MEVPARDLRVRAVTVLPGKLHGRSRFLTCCKKRVIRGEIKAIKFSWYEISPLEVRFLNHHPKPTLYDLRLFFVAVRELVHNLLLSILDGKVTEGGFITDASPIL